ncbi:MAG: hypothetical protein ABWK01_09230 [Infirmifilum sp.]
MEIFETVILAGVAIALSIMIAYFVSGIVFNQTQLELLSISYSLQGNRTLTIYLKNQGTKPTSVILVKVGEKAYPQNLYIQPGATATLTLPLEDEKPLYDVRVVTSSGVEYPLLVKA